MARGGGGRGGGRGKVSRMGSFLDQVELQDAVLSVSEAAQLHSLEKRRVSMNVLLVLLLCIADIGVVTMCGGIGAKVFSFSDFDIRTDLNDVALIIAIRSVVLSVFSVIGGMWIHQSDGIFWSYWFAVCTFVYGGGKLIMLDWNAGLPLGIYLGVLAWMAICIAELIVTTSLLYWITERTRWVDRPVAEEGQVEANLSTSLLGGVSRVKQNVKVDADEKPQLSTGGMAKVMKPYFWPKGILNKIRCCLTWVFLGLSKGANLMTPIYIGKVTQGLSEPTAPQSEVFTNIFIYCGLALSSKNFKELQNAVYLKVKQTAYVEIAEQTFTHLHSLSLEWHVKKKMGNVLRSMDRGVQAADTVVTYLFLYLVPSVAECTIVFVIFYSHFNIPTLSATAFMSFVFYAILTVQITLWRKKFREKTNKHDNDYHDKATDSLINYETVKYFTAEQYEIDRYTESIYKFQAYSVNTAYSLSFLNSAQSTIISVCTTICLCIAAHEVLIGGALKVGQFISVSAYVANLFAPLSYLGSIYSAIIQAIVDMTNLSELLAEEPDLIDDPSSKPLIPVPTGTKGASVEFRNVRFHYPTQRPSSGLQGLSFTIAPGTTTAVCGHTGAGKTTISRLLFRFYDPLSGKVLISNQDIKYVTQRSLRRAIGVVPQDTVLFNDTIRHNLAYGNAGATQEDIERACESAKILEFIKNLPEGFDTKVGERGLKLSGGEKQRVSIARCLLKNPPIILLDEATSALDSITERSVQGALDALANNRTTLVIAHRLTTIQNADQIIVLDKGQILESGTHEELLKKDGEYAELWSSRLEEQKSAKE